MKISKIALLLVFIMLSLTVMTGCRLAPFKEEWYFYSYVEDMTFINGVVLNIGFSDASTVYPFAGVDTDNIGISFTQDGKVEFTAKDGVTRYGTYTFEHIGNYTSFTITLEDGEIIEGSSMKSLKNKKLALTYKDTIYNFTHEQKRIGITIDSVISQIRNGNYGELNEASVFKNEDGYAVRFSEMVYYPIRETTAVYAVQINKDGSYEVLNELREGEVLSTYNNEADYVIIYYIEK
jgi:hypothetical protein